MGSVFGSIDGYESPKYELISKTCTYEIRLYDNCIAIDGPTSTENDGNGFGNLAKYIGVGSTPFNEKQQSISMTTPVVTYSNSDEARMQFILPSLLSDPPNPSNTNLEIKHRESAMFAVMQFSGLYTHKESVAKKDEFVALLKKDNVTMIEPIEWEFYRYNPPWTLPWLRINEIAIKVDKSQYGSPTNIVN